MRKMLRFWNSRRRVFCVPPPPPRQSTSWQLAPTPQQTSIWPPPEEVGLLHAMLLGRFAKIPVGIFAFVAASSAVRNSSEYNLSLFLSWRDLHFSNYGARAWNGLENNSKHSTESIIWQPFDVFVFKRYTKSVFDYESVSEKQNVPQTLDERTTLLKVAKVN